MKKIIEEVGNCIYSLIKENVISWKVNYVDIRDYIEDKIKCIYLSWEMETSLCVEITKSCKNLYGDGSIFLANTMIKTNKEDLKRNINNFLERFLGDYQSKLEIYKKERRDQRSNQLYKLLIKAIFPSMVFFLVVILIFVKHEKIKQVTFKQVSVDFYK